MASSRRIGVRVALALAGFALLAGSVQAECPPDFPPGLPCPQEPWETVQLEHDDRVARLRRLATDDLRFEFFSEIISPEEHGLGDFPTDIPVLRVVAGQDVFFDSGSDVIRPEAYRLLDVISGSLKLEPPDVALFVAGHTDWNGDEAYNYELGLRRAQSVAAALVRRGIYQASIYRVSFGELLPIDTNETERGRARNRRVEFLFSARTDAIVSLIVRHEIPVCAEQYRDELGRCKIEIKVVAEKVMVPEENRAQVARLERKAEELALDRTLTEVELEAARVEIEQQRAKIPIAFSPLKIPISVGLQ